MTNEKPNTIRVRWRAEPATAGGTPLAAIETVDDVPVTEDGRAITSYTVKIANTSTKVPLDIAVTSEMAQPGAVTNVTQPLVVEGDIHVEQHVVRDENGDILRTVQRKYPAQLFPVDVAKDEPEDTEDPDPGPDAA